MKHIRFIILPLIIFLTACQSWYHPKNDTDPVCRELNNRIVLSGATTDPRKADIQNAEKARLMQSYSERGC